MQTQTRIQFNITVVDCPVLEEAGHLLGKDEQPRCMAKLKGYLDQLCPLSPPGLQRVQGIGVGGWVVERVKSSLILVNKVWLGPHGENSEKYPEALKRLWERT